MKSEIKLNELQALDCGFTEYKQDELNLVIKVCEEVNEFWPCEVVCVMDDGYYNYPNIKLQHSFLSLYIRKIRKTNKIYNYSISCPMVMNFTNISHHDYNNSKREFNEPNNIGVLSKKKIEDWISFYENVYNALKSLSERNNNSIEVFLKQIKDSGLYVDWKVMDKSGDIRKNGMVFKFSIDNGLVNKKIEIDYSVTDSFKNFLLIADNKYSE